MDERLLVPVDEPYLHALGLATYCFSKLEWGAVWCCDRLRPGYVNKVSSKTAGEIGKDFVKFAATHPDPVVSAKLATAASEFQALVIMRNDLVHANPGTSKSGEQRLFRKGTEWTIPKVNTAADEFAAGDRMLNEILWNVLGGPFGDRQA